MAYFLRKIRGNIWSAITTKEDNFPADPLADLNTSNNRLSIFSVEKRNSKQIEYIIAGLASNRNNLDKLSYALIKDTELNTNGFAIEKSLGDTPCTKANEIHFEIIDLTAEKLVSFAKIINKSKLQITMLQKQVKDLLLDMYQQKELEKINTNILEKLTNRN